MRRLVLIAVLTACGVASAQFDLRGEVELGADATVSEAFPAQVGWTLSAHVAATYTLDPVDLRLVLDPSVRLEEDVAWAPGLTEAYAFASAGPADFSVGRERLPLATARLNVPYSVEGVGERGTRQGVTGARTHYYVGEWRLRGAVFLHPRTERVTPLASVKRSFGRFELETHVLYADQWVVGLGGSGLVGDLVAYGEGWFLSDLAEGRGALGVSGNLPTGGWTLEAAYLPPATVPGTAARPVVDGQVSLALDDYGDRGLSLHGGVAFDEDATRGRLGGSYTHALPDRVVTLSANGSFGPEPLALTTAVSVRGFF